METTPQHEPQPAPAESEQPALEQIALPAQLRILVTSGGTRVPIDAVREITNGSAGRTGALISQAALEHGHEVHYLHSRGAHTPFQRELAFNPDAADLSAEEQRIVADARRVVPLLRHATLERTGTFAQYRERVLELVARPEIDVAIMAMAASDYGPVAADGKISSTNDQLLIRCERLPKIISEIKDRRRDVFLVGFKLLLNEAPDALIERAYKSLLRDSQDLAVANVGRNSMSPEELLTYIITAERGVIPVARQDLPDTLLKIIEERFSRRYYRSELTKLEALPIAAAEQAEFLGTVQRCAKLALFNRYLADSREEFGFVAKRCAAGTLITARGSAKSCADDRDISVVTDVDETARTVRVTSTGKKASLNAPLAHLIMRARPEVNCIVHAHIELPEARAVGRDTSPATAEDWEAIKPLVESGAQIIQQPHHGVLILLEHERDLLPILERNNLYRTHAEHYDAAYHRFLANKNLTGLLEQHVPKDAAVLDLAAGTGEVTKQLLELGYSDITLADAAAPMLEVARGKLGRLLPESSFVHTRMEELPFEQRFGGVIVRQAINYLSPEALVPALSRMRDALQPGGSLVFNSFDPAALKQDGVRSGRAEADSKILCTVEGNLVQDGKLYHGQRSEVFDAHTGSYELIYDLNSFWLYTQSQFEEAITAAGFSSCEASAQGTSLYFRCGR